MTLDLLKRDESSARLTRAQHDANLTAIENEVNGFGNLKLLNQSDLPAAQADFRGQGVETLAAAFAAVTGAGSLPVADTTALVKDPVDATKLVRIDAGAIATGTTRVIAVPDRDIDFTADTIAATPSGNLVTTTVQGQIAELDAAKAEAATLGDFALVDFPAPGDTSIVVYGDGTGGKVGAGQLADTAVTPGSYTTADITVDAQGRITAAASGSAGSGLTLTNDANATITIGDAISGTHRRLTHATPALTLDAQGTVGTIVAATPAGGASASVAVESGATYFSKGGDQSGAGATTSFNIKGFAVFECVANGDGNSAKWFVSGDTDLAETVDGNLLISGTLEVDGQTNLDGVLDVDATSDFSGNVVLSGTATLTVAGLVTATAGVDANGNVTVAGNLTLDGSGKSLIGSGNTQYGFAVELVTASGALDNTHLGKRVTTSGSVTIPTTPTGWWCILILANVAHDITFDGATFDVSAAGWGVGDEIRITVTSATTAGAVRTPAASIQAL